MHGEKTKSEASPAEPEPGDGAPRQRKLTPAAVRALAEAEERRRQHRAGENAGPREVGGRGGKDPARYGDWEVKGIAVDF